MFDPPIFIICRDRVSGLRELVAWLERAGHQRIHLLDYGTTYEPALEYLAASSHVVERHPNHGHRGPWTSGRVTGFDEPYVVSDPDVVPDKDCPYDALDYFKSLLDEFPDRLKVGFGLRVDDCPDTWLRKEEILPWERYLWSDEMKIRDGVYGSPIDTTFALYRPNRSFGIEPAIRTGAPYRASHLPWYTDTLNPTEEEVYYAQHSQQSSTWADQQKQDWAKHGVRL